MAHVTESLEESRGKSPDTVPNDFGAKGRVTIKTVDPGPGLAIAAWLGEAGANVTGGYGGWNIIARPHRVSITQWGGRDPIQMDLPLVLDGFDGQTLSNRMTESIELVATKLERMALPWKDKPPRVKVTGSSSNLIQHDDLDWVIMSLAWGTALRDDAGNRLRQEVTVGLVAYRGVEKVKIRAAQLARNSAGRA